jgi:hypothetical protein
MNGKAQSQRIHARRRFAERFPGLNFNKRVRQEMSSKIKKGLGICVARQSHRVSVLDLEYDGKTYRLVWDKHRKNIVTVLPDGARQKGRG